MIEAERQTQELLARDPALRAAVDRYHANRVENERAVAAKLDALEREHREILRGSLEASTHRVVRSS